LGGLRGWRRIWVRRRWFYLMMVVLGVVVEAEV
jgi:hypothetical protein